jgi:uncharacterized protein YoxC
MESNTQTILIVFVAFTGAAVLLQACVLFAIFMSLRKTAKAVLDATEDMKATVVPMVHSTQDLLERLTPQIITVTTGLAELTETFRKETAGVSFSVSEIMGRVSRQTQRLDSMLTVGLNSVERASQVLESAVATPVRQANGILAAFKAVIETYRSTVPPRRTPYPDPDQDRDQFI